MHKISLALSRFSFRLLTLPKPHALYSKMVVTTSCDNGTSGTVSSPVKTDSRLKVKRLSEKAFIPTRGSKLAAGYDLYAAYDCVIPARGKNLVT